MPNPSDFFGLVAYLTVMTGRLPDRRMLEAIYAGDPGQRDRPALALVPVPVPARDETPLRRDTAA